MCQVPFPVLDVLVPNLAADRYALRGRDSCRLYGEHGIIVETSTNLEDILMSDYFQIEDRCVVQPGRDGGVRVDVEVQVSAVCLDFCSRCERGGTHDFGVL